MRLKWMKDTQQTVYMKEIARLSNTLRLPKPYYVVRQLRLFLDTQGYLCCGGHIHNAPVSEITKFPYLLPSQHQFSHIIILDVHVTLHHAGIGATLTALRQTY